MKSELKFNAERNVFCSKGFSNWNRAIEKFTNHESSKDHRDALAVLIHREKSNPIENQLNSQLESDQVKARQSLLSICSAIKYLARQNVALRGHDDEEGNFRQLLNLLKQRDKNLIQWMNPEKKKWLSWKIQNEFLDIMSAKILEIISDEIRHAKCYAAIVDGT